MAEWSGKHEAVERLLGLGAEEVKRRVLELLPSWREHVFQPLAAEASALAERDAEAKRLLARTVPPERLVERTTDGLQYAPRPDVHKLVFFPTYWQRPWVILGEYKHVKIYCYPIGIDHEQADERSAAEIARTYKALADENRLRLLRRLQAGPVTLTEAAHELGLAKSTTHHHLSILRHAGFVLIRDDHEKLYSLRPDLLPEAEDGSTANLAAVAAAASISRATLYRYYANREALLEALVRDAIDEAARRLSDAGLERAPVEEAIERILRAFLSVGDRYAVLVSDLPWYEKADRSQLQGPVRAVLRRGIESGVLRSDLSVEVLNELIGGIALSAIKLTQHQQLGLEEASAAAARLFLDGTRAH